MNAAVGDPLAVRRQDGDAVRETIVQQRLDAGSRAREWLGTSREQLRGATDGETTA